MPLYKIKPVIDIVVLLDVTGSMQECIDAVKASVATFIGSLSATDANNEAAIKDWRMKIVGYRDHQVSESNWFVDNPFVRDVTAVQTQLGAANMQASGGGDEPKSLLDALFRIANMGESGVQDGDDPGKWRARGSSSRAVIFFTDATFKTPMTIPEATGAGVGDVITALTGNKIILCCFCPEWSGYEELASLDRAYISYVATLADTPALAGLGKPGNEGRAAQAAAVNALKSRLNRGELNPSESIFYELARVLKKVLARNVGIFG